MQITTKTFKKISILALLLLCIISGDVYANPGDTTWVTVYNKRWLDHYGNYDTSATFPTGKRYRKIRLHYILGRYACPGNPQYCGSWDYTTQIYARHAGLDSVEIARVITPYATDWINKGKSNDYVIEVTDYASHLDGNCGMRFNYSGYSWGFTITLKIEFIEGVPPMDEIAVKNIYDGYFPYGNANNSIENYLTAKTFSYGNTVSRSFIKNTVSGHGADANDCSEFCSKYYKQKINGNVISQKQLWRNDCGRNEIYPQTGTWIYERANWCPGAVVWPIYHDISQVTGSSNSFSVDADMEPYTTATLSAGYNWVSQLITYGVPNHSLDVSVEDILSPTKDPNYTRENPSCASPIIRIKNVGTQTVSSVVVHYGFQGGASLTHTWTGHLNYLDTALVVLPPSTVIMTATTSATFTVNLGQVNGSTDQNAFNNIYQSAFTPAVVFPDTIVVKLFTNKSTDPITGKNESSWTLYDQNGLVYASRHNCNNISLYIDTVVLTPGCYKLSLDDSGCDGLSWWANTAAGNGSCRFERPTGGGAFFTFPSDIGCNFTKNFNVLPRPLNAVDVKSIAIENDLAVYPNPVLNQLYIKFDLNQAEKVNYQITDVSGKVVFKKSILVPGGAYDTIDVSAFDAGVYFVTANMNDGSKMVKKIIIQH